MRSRTGASPLPRVHKRLQTFTDLSWLGHTTSRCPLVVSWSGGGMRPAVSPLAGEPPATRVPFYFPPGGTRTPPNRCQPPNSCQRTSTPVYLRRLYTSVACIPPSPVYLRRLYLRRRYTSSASTPPARPQTRRGRPGPPAGTSTTRSGSTDPGRVACTTAANTWLC